MSRERIILGAMVAACAAMLVAVLVLRRGEGPSGSAATEPGSGSGQEIAATGEPPVPPETGAAQEAAPTPAGTPGAGAEGQPAPSFTSEQNRREVVLFFQESDSDFLGPERRKIFLTSSLADLAKQIVVELINGPEDPDLRPTLPAETRLRGLYLDRRGTAYVDLSEEVATLHPGGTAEELASIFSLVNSLTYNLSEIKRVHLLIGGEERDTLKEHLDLRRDYVKDLSIVDMDRRPGR
jgi:germination protein M